MIVIHNLKTLQPYYDAVVRGEKPFEIRKNDRKYQVGDFVCLRECYHLPPDGDEIGELKFTSRLIWKKIQYITDYGQKPGYVVFAMRNLDFNECMALIDEIKAEKEKL